MTAFTFLNTWVVLAIKEATRCGHVRKAVTKLDRDPEGDENVARLVLPYRHERVAA
jgi:hypothetical protein